MADMLSGRVSLFSHSIYTVVFFTVLSYSNNADLVRRSIGISEIVIPMT